MAASMNSIGIAEFYIKRYASLANPCQVEDEGMLEANSKERWIHHDATDETIILSINKEFQFLLRKGLIILENFSLLVASGDLRAIAKGDSIMVLCREKNQNRKFRLQFCEEENQSGIERCQQCLKHLCSYVQIKRTNSQLNSQQENLTLSSLCSVEDGTESVTKSTECTIPELYNTLDPTQMDEEIVRCLLDANFLPLVNRVENRLCQLW